jgi:hypothetical protein
LAEYEPLQVLFYSKREGINGKNDVKTDGVRSTECCYYVVAQLCRHNQNKGLCLVLKKRSVFAPMGFLSDRAYIKCTTLKTNRCLFAERNVSAEIKNKLQKNKLLFAENNVINFAAETTFNVHS